MGFCCRFASIFFLAIAAVLAARLVLPPVRVLPEMMLLPAAPLWVDAFSKLLCNNHDSSSSPSSAMPVRASEGVGSEF